VTWSQRQSGVSRARRRTTRLTLQSPPLTPPIRGRTCFKLLKLLLVNMNNQSSFLREGVRGWVDCRGDQVTSVMPGAKPATNAKAKARALRPGHAFGGASKPKVRWLYARLCTLSCIQQNRSNRRGSYRTCYELFHCHITVLRFY